MAFPDGFIDEVRRAADIVRVIEGDMPLRDLWAPQPEPQAQGVTGGSRI